MVKRNPVEKKIQRKCYVVGLIAFVSALFLAYFFWEISGKMNRLQRRIPHRIQFAESSLSWMSM